MTISPGMTAPQVSNQSMIPLKGGVRMWQGHLILPASSAAASQPRRGRRVYTPTPDGFEHFLRACVGLAPVAGALTLDLSS